METLLSNLVLLVLGVVLAIVVREAKQWLKAGAPVDLPGLEPISVVQFAQMLRELARTAVSAAEQLGLSENLEELGVEALEYGEKLGEAKLEWAISWIENELERAGYDWVPVETIRAYVEAAVRELAQYAVVVLDQEAQHARSQSAS